ALQVKDDLGDVFLHTRDGAELVQHTVDADAGHGGTRDRGEQGTTQGVPQGVTEAWFERFDDEPGPELRNVLFGQGGALCNKHCGFLSAKCPLFDTCFSTRWLARRSVELCLADEDRIRWLSRALELE